MRKFIFISSGILFLIIAAGLIIVGSVESDTMMIILSAASIPFMFTAYWNFYSVHFEKKLNKRDGYFTVKAAGYAGIGAFYDKAVVLPVFLVLFGSVAFAIVIAFLAANRSLEDISIGVLVLSFLYSTALTVVFAKRIGKSLRSPDEVAVQKENDFGVKLAFFFASVATLGLFPLVYFLYKYLSRKNK